MHCQWLTFNNELCKTKLSAGSHCKWSKGCGFMMEVFALSSSKQLTTKAKLEGSQGRRKGREWMREERNEEGREGGRKEKEEERKKEKRRSEEEEKEGRWEEGRKEERRGRGMWLNKAANRCWVWGALLGQSPGSFNVTTSCPEPTRWSFWG